MSSHDESQDAPRGASGPEPSPAPEDAPPAPEPSPTAPSDPKGSAPPQAPPEERPSAPPAGPGAAPLLRAFLRRALHVLVRPSGFWRALRETDDVRSGEIVAIHVGLLALAAALAGFVGDLVSGAAVGTATLQLLTQFVTRFVAVLALGVFCTALLVSEGARASGRDGLALAAYGATPLFVAGILGVIPIPYVAHVADIAAMPWAFHLLAAGIRPLMRVPDDRAPTAAAHVCGGLLVIWTLVPTLLPVLLRTLGEGG